MGKSYTADLRVRCSDPRVDHQFFSKSRFPGCFFSSYKNLCRHSSLVPRPRIKHLCEDRGVASYPLLRPFDLGKEKGVRQRAFLHCGNCDSLAVAADAHFDPHLAGCHLAARERAEDCSFRLQLWFVIKILQNKVQFDPRSLKKLICS